MRQVDRADEEEDHRFEFWTFRIVQEDTVVVVSMSRQCKRLLAVHGPALVLEETPTEHCTLLMPFSFTCPASSSRVF